MTWTHVKRWIGTHPVVIMAVINGGCGFLFIGAIFALGTDMAALSPSPPVSYLLLKLGCLALPLLAIAATCFVGCLRGRAGLPIMGVRNKAALLIWASYGVAVAVLVIFAGGRTITAEELEGSLGNVIVILAVIVAGIATGGLLLTLPSALYMMLGLRLAEEITRRQIGKGKWEHTEPVERPKENRT